jgi:hypothetical protein
VCEICLSVVRESEVGLAAQPSAPLKLQKPAAHHLQCLCRALNSLLLFVLLFCLCCRQGSH